ncbi:fluoride efflux transporter FluC [Loigolactobacillus jiayinensis]|uniref:Fluoride-specific ion channel FluC n=1 Tax=Loigolactobacillus jiayinensis TaxID=2486016 RepID=A0ABW1RDS8_9LACO|nr:CrcB family protein [Loigolactobacillus jiayinensis]
MNYIVVGLFAFFGGGCRYLLSSWSTTFPWGTLIVNLVGCFVLVWLTQYLAQILPLSERLVLGAGTGFVGAFTTFSTFSLETIKFIQTQQYLAAALYVGISLVGGLACASAGLLVGQLAHRREGAHD